MSLVEDDSITIPMIALDGLSVSGHEAVGMEVSYVPPPEDYVEGNIYIHYGEVTRFFSNGFLEVEIDAWSAATARSQHVHPTKHRLQHPYKMLIDETVDGDVSVGGLRW